MKYNSIINLIFLTCLLLVIAETQASNFQFINRFDKYFNNFQYNSHRLPLQNNKYVNRITPSSDIFETENEIIIQTDLPGVSNPSVEVEGTSLVIRGKFDFESFPFEFRNKNNNNNNNNNVYNDNDNNKNDNKNDNKNVNKDKERVNVQMNINEMDGEEENINVNFIENEMNEFVEENAQEFVGEKIIFEGRYLQRERTFQRSNDEFYRLFQFNVNFDKNKIEAKIKNGLLTVIIPKLQPVKVPILIS